MEKRRDKNFENQMEMISFKLWEEGIVKEQQEFFDRQVSPAAILQKSSPALIQKQPQKKEPPIIEQHHEKPVSETLVLDLSQIMTPGIKEKEANQTSFCAPSIIGSAQSKSGVSGFPKVLHRQQLPKGVSLASTSPKPENINKPGLQFASIAELLNNEIYNQSKHAQSSTPDPNASLEEKKLLWTKDEEAQDLKKNSSSKDLRFDFNGNCINSDGKDKIDEFPSYSGLYHHGEDHTSPGYTLKELMMLMLSAVPSQCATALTIATNIISKVRNNECTAIGMDDLINSSLPVYLRRSLDGPRKFVWYPALKSFHSLLNSPDFSMTFLLDYSDSYFPLSYLMVFDYNHLRVPLRPNSSPSRKYDYDKQSQIKSPILEFDNVKHQKVLFDDKTLPPNDSDAYQSDIILTLVGRTKFANRLEYLLYHNQDDGSVIKMCCELFHTISVHSPLSLRLMLSSSTLLGLLVGIVFRSFNYTKDQEFVYSSEAKNGYPVLQLLMSLCARCRLASELVEGDITEGETQINNITVTSLLQFVTQWLTVYMESGKLERIGLEHNVAAAFITLIGYINEWKIDGWSRDKDGLTPILVQLWGQLNFSSINSKILRVCISSFIVKTVKKGEIENVAKHIPFSCIDALADEYIYQNNNDKSLTVCDILLLGNFLKVYFVSGSDDIAKKCDDRECSILTLFSELIMKDIITFYSQSGLNPVEIFASLYHENQSAVIIQPYDSKHRLAESAYFSRMYSFCSTLRTIVRIMGKNTKQFSDIILAQQAVSQSKWGTLAFRVLDLLQQWAMHACDLHNINKYMGAHGAVFRALSMELGLFVLATTSLAKSNIASMHISLKESDIVFCRDFTTAVRYIHNVMEGLFDYEIDYLMKGVMGYFVSPNHQHCLNVLFNVEYLKVQSSNPAAYQWVLKNAEDSLYAAYFKEEFSPAVGISPYNLLNAKYISDQNVNPIGHRFINLYRQTTFLQRYPILTFPLSEILNSAKSKRVLSRADKEVITESLNVILCYVACQFTAGDFRISQKLLHTLWYEIFGICLLSMERSNDCSEAWTHSLIMLIRILCHYKSNHLGNTMLMERVSDVVSNFVGEGGFSPIFPAISAAISSVVIPVLFPVSFRRMIWNELGEIIFLLGKEFIEVLSEFGDVPNGIPYEADLEIVSLIVRACQSPRITESMLSYCTWNISGFVFTEAAAQHSISWEKGLFLIDLPGIDLLIQVSTRSPTLYTRSDSGEISLQGMANEEVIQERKGWISKWIGNFAPHAQDNPKIRDVLKWCTQ